VAVGAAVIHLIAVDLSARGARAPAFVDAWALTLWLLTVSVVVLAVGWWRRVEVVNATERVLALLWIVAGALLFVGVTQELTRFFRQAVMSPSTARLAGGLAVSAWWAVFAAGLVILGFQRKLKAVRIAGLAVSGLAVAKVLVFDLSELDALYRIASVFTLGLVSLGVAYLYHRQAKAAEPPSEP
jgi:uncharacterized membrane protein